MSLILRKFTQRGYGRGPFWIMEHPELLPIESQMLEVQCFHCRQTTRIPVSEEYIDWKGECEKLQKFITELTTQISEAEKTSADPLRRAEFNRIVSAIRDIEDQWRREELQGETS